MRRQRFVCKCLSYRGLGSPAGGGEVCGYRGCELQTYSLISKNDAILQHCDKKEKTWQNEEEPRKSRN
jgi:hypothetical protein